MASLSEWLRAAAKDTESGVDADLMRKGADEIDRLTAIVARLPKTADGVPITPRMPFYVARQPDGAIYPEKASGMYPPDSLYGVVTWSDCYSTREAAEAARKETT